MPTTIDERYTLCKLGLFETCWILRAQRRIIREPRKRSAFEIWVGLYKIVIENN